MGENRTLRVGVFDSGIGGLTVLRACMRHTSGVTYYYFGDNLNAPYGGRSHEEIAGLVEHGLCKLEQFQIDAAVLACNTASAVCLEKMRARFSFPIVGMEPAVAPAAKTCKRVLVLCTPRTAESERLKGLIARYPQCKFTIHAAEGLAGAIEANLLYGTPLDLCDHLPRGEWEGVVLGCTHYSFLQDEIAKFYGIQVFDGADGTALRLADLLKVGISNHLTPQSSICAQMFEKCKISTKTSVYFVGPCEKMNKTVFLANICSK